MELFGYSLWVILFICAGVFCASFVDAIGGGGGLISLPVYLLAGLPPHLALGTNKLSSCIGTAASTLRYLHHSRPALLLAAPSVVLALLGAHLGTKAQLTVNEVYLKYFLLVALPVAAVILMCRRSFPEQAGVISRHAQRAIVWSSSLLLGFYDGFYGPGTGTFLLMIFCFFAKMDLRTASANVKLVNLSSNLGAMVTSLLAGKVLVPIGLMAALFSVLGHYIGAGLTLKNGGKIVRPIILFVLLLLILKVLLEVTGT